ncbi:MAG: Glycosyl transferase, group 1 family protein [candidate division WS6 bacterium GW2011_GWF2_39_15]|uniref:Glycosyl transferase, group 1 family protein n=1 Tax=candidate division WS6 bacterium GW2011_GWF2_39_15 TaxID=1619100 RepID=A0A0G0MQI0_9BACT|nr:MAG: Glycosyl transferase, group 1 family protein [candidate division WS6 bacterium GW2011_GWF2_39_15]
MSKDTVLVITSYPSKDTKHDKGVSGLASFAKNTVESIPKDNINIIVLAEKKDKFDVYKEGDVLVKRIWQRNTLRLYFQLFKQAWIYRKVSNKILLEFEYSVYGSNFVTGFMPIFIIAARVLGYKTVSVMHQVIRSREILSQNLGLAQRSFKLHIVYFLTQIFTRFFTFVSSHIVVLDEVHKQNLKDITNIKKVTVIPHGVEQRDVVQKETGKKINLLYFGFLAWYKGADWLIDSYLEFSKHNPELADKFHITMAGGESPTQSVNPKYREYYDGMVRKANENKNITITGFVKEEDFDTIFGNADIQILPYRAIMSSSGPLSWAFTYEKPVLLSNILSPYLETEDIKEVLNELKISSNQFTFNLDKPFKLFERLLEMPKPDLNRLSEFSREVKGKRNWKWLGEKYLSIILS